MWLLSLCVFNLGLVDFWPRRVFQPFFRLRGILVILLNKDILVTVELRLFKYFDENSYFY